MARIRSNLRSSSRWGGKGQEYDTGYQYNVPDRKPLRFGPFKRIWPLGERNVPQDTLQSLKDGVIRDNVIYPIWFRQTTTVINRTVLAADEFGLIPDLFHVQFYKANDAGDVIKAFYDDGTTSGIDASAIVSDGTQLSAAAWQKYIYFGCESIAGIKRYSPVDHAFVNVAGSPTPKYLFFLDNNLVAILKSGSSWIAQWSADSLPEDFTGPGSGFAPIPSYIGEVMGVGKMNDAYLIVGTRGAQLLQPTGTASPAFKLDNVDSVRGTRYESVTSVADVVYFVDFERRLVYFDGNRVLPVGAGVPFFGDTPTFYPSARVGLLFVSIPANSKTYLLNTTTQEWVSLLDDSYDFISDTPFSHDAGRVYCFKNVVDDYEVTSLDLDPDSYTQPQLETGRFDIGHEVYIDEVIVVRTAITSPIPVLRVLRQLQDGTIDISTFLASQAEEKGTKVIYRVNSYAEMIEIQFGYPVLEGPFLTTEYSPGGNFIINPQNPSGYFRADDDISGNFSVSEDALTWIGLEYNAAGNMVLVEADLIVDDVWLADTGVEYIEVMLQKESNEPTAIG